MLLAVLFNAFANLPTACVKDRAGKSFFIRPATFLFFDVSKPWRYPQKNLHFINMHIWRNAILRECGPAGRLPRPWPTFLVEKRFRQIAGFLTFREAPEKGCGKAWNEAAQPLVLQEASGPWICGRIKLWTIVHKLVPLLENGPGSSEKHQQA